MYGLSTMQDTSESMAKSSSSGPDCNSLPDASSGCNGNNQNYNINLIE